MLRPVGCLMCVTFEIRSPFHFIMPAGILGSAGTGQFGCLGVSWNGPVPETLVPPEDDLGECFDYQKISISECFTFFLVKILK